MTRSCRAIWNGVVGEFTSPINRRVAHRELVFRDLVGRGWNISGKFGAPDMFSARSCTRSTGWRGTRRCWR